MKFNGQNILIAAIFLVLGCAVGRHLGEIVRDIHTPFSKNFEVPFPGPETFLGLNAYNSAVDWKLYEFEIGRGREDFKKQGTIALRLPEDVKTTEMFLREPERTLVVEAGDSRFYIGDHTVFSTDGTLYCTECQLIGMMSVKIFGEFIEVPVVQDRQEGGGTRFVTKLHLPLEPCSNCWYDASVMASSLDDFLLFLAILETAAFRPL